MWDMMGIKSRAYLSVKTKLSCFILSGLVQIAGFTYHHHTTTVLRPFFRDHPGEPVPEENFWTLWCKGRLTEADTPTILLGATPSGLTSAHLHHPTFFTGRMPFLPPNQQVSKHITYWIINHLRACLQDETKMAVLNSHKPQSRFVRLWLDVIIAESDASMQLTTPDA